MSREGPISERTVRPALPGVLFERDYTWCFNTMRNMANELRDVAPGLWLWRVDHPDWHTDLGWERTVTSTCVESGGEVVLLDPLAPPDDATDVWARLDAHPPTVIVILKPDHLRDVDLFARRYKVRAFGPNVFHGGDVPETHLEVVEPDTKLPGGLIALYRRARA